MARHRVRVLFGSALCLLCVFCNRTVGGDLAHVAPPNADGKDCNNDVECASDHCAGVTVFGPGTCAPPAKGAVEIDGDCSGGAPCVGDATCEDGLCVANAQACVALLAPCAVDDDCCSGVCATPFGSTLPQGSCTAGAGMCAGEDGTCLLDSDCCAGRCDFRMVTSPGRGQCSSVCRGFGESCKVGECCGGYCSEPSPNCFDGPQCLECLTPTIADGNSCVADYDCCGETCVGAAPQSPGTCECMTPGGCDN